ncbi:MAG: NADH-quinone oxidoreductase subunit L, partial [Alphaproteobacteria bacterium]
MSLNELILATVFLPLIGALISGLLVRTIGDARAQLVTCLPMVAAALSATAIFAQIAGHEVTRDVLVMPWIASGDFRVNWALRVDALTAVMLVLVTWVSAVVHVYSVGYMSHDEHKPRFMAYLSLFTFCMLMLVTSDNFIQLFFGWEGVGLCSYLLIGFWFKKPEANAAAIKAFIVNRVGDFGFALGIAAIFMVFGSVDFGAASRRCALAAAGPRAAGARHDLPAALHGRDGQIGAVPAPHLLPDAMEGPTPVSALIHAATMVTAGVFMVARCSPLFELAPIALMVVTYVGAITAFLPHRRARCRTTSSASSPIRPARSWATCSSPAASRPTVRGYSHLFTHGFFKALLFLGAGSVIHAVSGEQDMRKMGGLWRKIPYTYALMWIGSLRWPASRPSPGIIPRTPSSKPPTPPARRRATSPTRWARGGV